MYERGYFKFSKKLFLLFTDGSLIWSGSSVSGVFSASAAVTCLVIVF